MKRIVIIILIALVIVFMGALSSCRGKGDAPFYRAEVENFQPDTEHFQVDKQMGKIFFQKGEKKFQLNDIPTPNGYYFYLKGKKQLKINPQFTGETGFYTYLYFESLTKGGSIDFTLEIHRESANQTIAQLVDQKVSQPFFKDMEIAGGDLLLLKFKGRGVVYFSKPILYKKKENPGRKNIIFIALDTLRGDQIGARKGNHSLTPHIDRFLKDSVYFRNAYASTSWTLPSFMSLFTALYEYHHEVGITKPLSLEKPFLINQISRKFITFGYHGGMVMNSRWGYWQGFDYYKYFHFAGSLFPRGGQSLFQKAVELLETSDFPNLFLFLHTYQVHAPYTPPEEFLHQLNKQPKFKKLEVINYNNPAKTYVPVDDDVKKSLKELYQAEILAFDSYFGEFINRLKAMDLYNNTMIVFMSDHGEEFFEHKGWAHSHSLYDELIKVPIIIKFPGSRFKNSEINDLVGIIDIFPTILSFYGIEYAADGLDGKDLMPLVASGQKRSPAYMVSSISTGRYFEAIPPRIAILFDNYKLIYNHPFSPEDLAFFKDYTLPPETPKFELYNLADDPDERQNIAKTLRESGEKMMPILLEIVKKVNQKMAAKGKKSKSLDKEVEEQLKSLGYL